MRAHILLRQGVDRTTVILCTTVPDTDVTDFNNKCLTSMCSSTVNKFCPYSVLITYLFIVSGVGDQLDFAPKCISAILSRRKTKFRDEKILRTARSAECNYTI